MLINPANLFHLSLVSGMQLVSLAAESLQINIFSLNTSTKLNLVLIVEKLNWTLCSYEYTLRIELVPVSVPTCLNAIVQQSRTQ